MIRFIEFKLMEIKKVIILIFALGLAYAPIVAMAEGQVLNPDLSEIAMKNLEASHKFFEQNKKKAGVVTLPSGLQYKVVEAGSGPIPDRKDYVKVHFRATYLNGKEFDNSEKHGPPEIFEVAAVIPGWSEALQKMKTGSKWILYIPPDLAYGKHGLPGKVEPNQGLIYEVQLLNIVPTPYEGDTNILEREDLEEQ
jgi:FKBP-type peptidyl-prolyl cis-trans isomerase FklB